MGWNVKYNHFGAVAKAVRRGLADEVTDLAQHLETELKSTLWFDTGMVRRVTTDRKRGKTKADVAVGWNRGHGFYSRFNEWGTIKQAARPIVGPAAHRAEPQFRKEVAGRLREASRAR